MGVPAVAGMGVPAVAGMEFPAVAEDVSLADDAGGLPLVIRVSEPLRAAAEADPLIDVGKASSVDLREHPMQNTGEPRDLENDRLGRRDGMDIPPDIRTEGHESPHDSREATVVGAVSSAAPWFLTEWAEGVEVDFMINTGCQVTILATSVFERMCVSDPDCVHVAAGWLMLTLPR